MNTKLYNVTVQCPVCSEKIEVTKVKSKSCKVLSRDSDFCTYYEDTNPLFYDIWVCGHCGYAAMEDKFQSIGLNDSKVLLEKIKPKWNERNFMGERTIDAAIQAFKLALYNQQLIKGKPSELAKISIRLAWLYRMKNDKRERKFLDYALKCYMETYENQPLPADKLDTGTCMYIIAELNRRLGNFEEALKWFSRMLSSPEVRKNANLMDNVREQIIMTREQMKGNGIGDLNDIG